MRCLRRRAESRVDRSFPQLDGPIEAVGEAFTVEDAANLFVAARAAVLRTHCGARVRPR